MCQLIISIKKNLKRDRNNEAWLSDGFVDAGHVAFDDVH